jgi:ABC-type transport system involved in cytochrome bd biosynthesis fused ATPase/permease subunit
MRRVGPLLAAAALLLALVLLVVVFWRVILELVFLGFALPLLYRVAQRFLGIRPRARKRSLFESATDLVTAISTMLIARNTIPIRAKRERQPPTTPQPVYSTRPRGPGDLPEGY